MRESIYQASRRALHASQTSTRRAYSTVMPVLLAHKLTSASCVATFFASGAAYIATTTTQPLHDESNRLSLGEVSEEGKDNLLYVPGSISNANITGKKFTDLFTEITKERPKYINSQMDITEYPGQLLASHEALLRNSIVESGIMTAINKSGEDEFTIIAHSAGAKSALASVNKYYHEHPESKKKINIILAGAGSPSLDLQTELEAVKSNNNVKIHEFRNKLDFVPDLGGTTESGHDITHFVTSKSQTAIATIQAAIDQEPEHGEWSPLSLKAAIAIANSSESHFCTEYAPIIAEYYLRQQKEHITRKLLTEQDILPMLAVSPNASIAKQKNSKKDNSIIN